MVAVVVRDQNQVGFGLFAVIGLFAVRIDMDHLAVPMHNDR